MLKKGQNSRLSLGCWPWHRWPWRAVDVGAATRPSPWSAPAVADSRRCRRSRLRSALPLPPVRESSNFLFTQINWQFDVHRCNNYLKQGFWSDGKIVVTHLSLDWFALTVNHSIWCHNAKRRRVGLYDFELHRAHATAHEENVTFVNRSVRFQEVWLQVDFEKIAAS